MSNIDASTESFSIKKLSVLEEFGDGGSTHAICHFSSRVAICRNRIYSITTPFTSFANAAMMAS